MSLLFKRTFYPVGQGAFYAAEVYDQTSDSYQRLFRAVYDCGSNTRGAKKYIKNVIENEMNKGEIDLLFISHFDRDHINCIKYLKPKNVVVPFILGERVNILKACDTGFDAEKYQKINTLFPNRPRIIWVHPRVGSNRNPNLSQELELLMAESQESYGNNVNLESESPITVSDARNRLLEYIVYSPNIDDFFATFEEEIKKASLDFDKIRSGKNGDYVKAHIDEIKGIYNSLKNKNAHSLVVYSNILWDSDNFRYFRFLLPTSLGQPKSSMNLYGEYHHHPAGCIYFGDITVDNKWLKDFYNNLGPGRIARIGAMQIPHHGARSSKGDLILSTTVGKFKKLLCVASVGTTNRYNHPSNSIIENIKNKGADVIIVNEHRETKLIGIGKINNQI